MKNYNAEDICAALENAGIESSETVMMHSSPITLGRFAGTNVADEIISAIRGYLGENGTLVVPAFNFDFCQGTAFDRLKTPSKNMGVLSETVRLSTGAERSFHPMQSVAAIGKSAADICRRNTPTAFSPQSCFDRLLELNAKLLMLGVNFNAASFFHFAEEKISVPYRYFKTFTGEYIDEDIREMREYQMYVRDLELNPQLDLRLLERKMEAGKKIKRAKLGMGEIIVCSFADLDGCACEMLEKDTLAFLKNKEDIAAKLSQR